MGENKGDRDMGERDEVGGKYQESSFKQVKLEIPVRYPSSNVKYNFVCQNLNIMSLGWW